jgi:hypothetical protein
VDIGLLFVRFAVPGELYQEGQRRRLPFGENGGQVRIEERRQVKVVQFTREGKFTFSASFIALLKSPISLCLLSGCVR